MEVQQFITLWSASGASERANKGSSLKDLPHQSATGPGARALCLPGRQGVPKIRAFTEFVAEVLGPMDSERVGRGA